MANEMKINTVVTTTGLPIPTATTARARTPAARRRRNVVAASTTAASPNSGASTKKNPYAMNPIASNRSPSIASPEANPVRSVLPKALVSRASRFSPNTARFYPAASKAERGDRIRPGVTISGCFPERSRTQLPLGLVRGFCHYAGPRDRGLCRKTGSHKTTARLEAGRSRVKRGATPRTTDAPILASALGSALSR
jgi:hypothetical protein